MHELQGEAVWAGWSRGPLLSTAVPSPHCDVSSSVGASYCVGDMAIKTGILAEDVKENSCDLWNSQINVSLLLSWCSLASLKKLLSRRAQYTDKCIWEYLNLILRKWLAMNNVNSGFKNWVRNDLNKHWTFKQAEAVAPCGSWGSQNW